MREGHQRGDNEDCCREHTTDVSREMIEAEAWGPRVEHGLVGVYKPYVSHTEGRPRPGQP
jgi:hypothetical protein